MKITCDSCGAKYTIADDKVSGRKVKIRCKGCGTPIVVDGAQPGASGASGTDLGTSEAPASLAETSAEWSVNLSESDQRTMSTQELVDGWAAGTVTVDAFVWKEGMSDWVPILESAELAPLLRAPRTSALPQARPASVRPAATTSRGGAGRAQAGADLFAAAAIAGSEVDEAPVGPGFPQAGGHADDVRPTGARNENSVLFSLDALKAGFSGAAAPAAQAKNKGSSPPRRGATGRNDTSEDDPFGLGSAGSATAAPMFSLADNSALLTAPAPPEPPPKPVIVYAESGSAAPAASSKKGLIIGIIAVLLVGGAGGAYALSAKKEKEEALQAAAAAAASAEKAREDERTARAAEERAREEQKAAEAHAQAAPPATAGEAANKPPEEKAAEASKAATPGSAAGAKKEAAPKKEDTTKPKDTAAPAAAAGGDQPFNKSAAISALGAASNGAASCKKLGGPTGSGKVTVTFANSGRVTSANVNGGPFAGTSVGGCVASLFRKAKVPPFSGSPVTVSKSFAIN
jgi:predicted Zn finger-like uncharacterized protein